MAFDRLFEVRSGYIGLGDCPTGLGNWPHMVRAPPQELEIVENL